jgi:hypothetical protein
MRELVEGEDAPENLLPLMATIKTIPCSTAECERVFSLMNLIALDLRSTLTVQNTFNSMFVNANGPPLQQVKLKDYVKTWLKKPSSANDTRHKSTKATPSEKRSLWTIL